MNVVGPQPEQPTIFVYLRVQQTEGYQRRQRVRPVPVMVLRRGGC